MAAVPYTCLMEELIDEIDADDQDYRIQNSLDNAIRAFEDAFNEPLDPM